MRTIRDSVASDKPVSTSKEDKAESQQKNPQKEALGEVGEKSPSSAAATEPTISSGEKLAQEKQQVSSEKDQREESKIPGSIDLKGEAAADQKKALEKPTGKQTGELSQESEKLAQKQAEKAEAKQPEKIKLQGLFAFKVSMSGFYSNKGKAVPVTALKYIPCKISQIKNLKIDYYEAVQLAFKAQKNNRSSKALIGHLSPAGFKQGARFVREIRQKPPKGAKLGQEVSIESLKKGDWVKISSFSKGKGFAGVMKRWNFAGGKASHGSKSHRRPGSIGQHTEPARVFPGRKMPGRMGFKKHTVKAPVVEILPEENLIFVKGPVAGARNSLVSLLKMPEAKPKGEAPSRDK